MIEVLEKPAAGPTIRLHAAGEKTKSEILGLGDHEFVPWNIGVTG